MTESVGLTVQGWRGWGQYQNREPPGGVKFFKFIANFQIGIGYQIFGLFFNQHFTFMIHKALKALRLVALPWQNTQNLTFINLILLHGALLFSFEAGNQPFNIINTHIIHMCNRSDVSLSDTCINKCF